MAAFHGHEIESFEEASAFVDRLDHWQMARQALHYAVVSKASEDLAWREFRRGLAWLIEAGFCAQMAEAAENEPDRNRFKRMEAAWRALAEEQIG